ncbi:hypothetical protein Kisp02_25290 [Kineosporia sp. NBRC 101731]|nr:hypothetical protein Kisp02_25290 [Kineosporia sp. NBRC 101731]
MGRYGCAVPGSGCGAGASRARDDLEILDPPELREMFADLGRRVSRLYSRRTPRAAAASVKWRTLVVTA